MIDDASTSRWLLATEAQVSSMLRVLRDASNLVEDENQRLAMMLFAAHERICTNTVRVYVGAHETSDVPVDVNIFDDSKSFDIITAYGLARIIVLQAARISTLESVINDVKSTISVMLTTHATHNER